MNQPYPLGQGLPDQGMMNVLTFNHADDHPAERLQVASILPHNVTLTQKIIQRIIESGSGSHFSAVECGNFPA
jgi:hypothetical protein